MSNNRSNPSGRNMDFNRHQEIVKGLNETIQTLNQRLESAEAAAVRATELSYQHEQLIDEFSELYESYHSVQRDKGKLMQQISMLQDVNLNIQYQLTTLQSKKAVSCKHMFQCGCGMSLCNNCAIISQCSQCDFHRTSCDFCHRSPKLCNDQTCIKYYERRFDNCDCNSLYCNFCIAKNIVKDKITIHLARG